MNRPASDPRPILSYVDFVAQIRAKLAKELLEQPENVDQSAEARLWGDRQRRVS